MKKLLSMLLALTMMVSLVALSAQAEEKKTYRVAMVSDTGGINDNSFNASAWEGLQRAKEELGITVSYLESVTEADYEANMETLFDEGNDLIICVGFLMADACKKAAEEHPDQMYAIIDSTSSAPNVVGVLFAQEQCSYLAGVAAGKMTKTNNVGFVLGMANPIMHAFGYGYYAGVRDTNPDCQVQGINANSFGDAAGGKAATINMYAKGADIVYHAAGGTGDGVIEAAKEQKKFAIGVDKDQSYVAPEAVLTSAVKRVDNGVFDLCKKVQKGELKGGDAVYDLTTGGVDIAKTVDLMSPEALKAVEEAKDKIIKGEIKVPATQEAFEALYGADYYGLD